MKTLIILALISVTFDTTAQNKWDVALKIERNYQSWLQVETRYHVNNRFSITAQINGNIRNENSFSLYGYVESNNLYYYQNRNRDSKSAKANIGIQYYLPFKKKRFYVSANMGSGYITQTTYYSYYNGLSPNDNTLETDPSQSYGFSLLLASPTNETRSNEHFFVNTNLNLGVDLPIGEKLLFTSSISSGLEMDNNFVSLYFSAAAGLRYKLGKTTE